MTAGETPAILVERNMPSRKLGDDPLDETEYPVPHPGRGNPVGWIIVVCLVVASAAWIILSYQAGGIVVGLPRL